MWTPRKELRKERSAAVLLLRGITQGVSTAQLAEELGLSYQQTLTLRQRLQNNANETAPMELMEGKQFESDEVYQNAGKKSDVHTDPDDPPRRRGNN